LLIFAVYYAFILLKFQQQIADNAITAVFLFAFAVNKGFIQKGFVFILNKKLLKKLFNICILPLYFYGTL